MLRLVGRNRQSISWRMDPPILRLHSHGWRSILDYLDTSDISRLVCLGSQVISSCVQHSVENLNVLWSRAYIDLDKVTTFASMFYRLSELSIRGHYGRNTVAKWPIDASLFPQRLTSLKMCFRYSIHAFFELGIASSLPNLLGLELVSSSDLLIDLKIVKFPPLLQRLTLHGSLDIAYTFDKLPRTLLELDLRGCKSLETSEIPTFADFMPGLISLTTRGGTFDVDQLPPGLTKIHFLTSTQLISSALGGDFKTRPFYPWRSCFPRLIDLSLPMTHPIPTFGHIIDPHSLNKTPDFAPIRKMLFLDLKRSQAHSIACMDPNELVNSDENTVILDQTFCTYKRLEVMFKTDVNLEELDKDLIPLLMDLEYCHVEGWPQPLLNWMRKLTALNLGEFVSLNPDTIFSSTLTTLKAEEVHARLLPASLTSLSCGKLNCSQVPYGVGTDVFHFPCPSLTELEMLTTALTPSVASILPCSITKLTTSFPGHASDSMNFEMPSDLNEFSKSSNQCDLTWTALVLRLDRLRKLIIKRTYGAPSRLLTPFVSTVLEELTLIDACQTGDTLWLSTLLDGVNISGRPPVLPPSLRSLTLNFGYGAHIHVSALALLPNSLTSLTTSGLTTDKRYIIPNFPFDRNISLVDIFSYLPPNLRCLRCICSPNGPADIVQVPPKALAGLPQTLEIFDFAALFVDFEGATQNTTINMHHVARVVKLMPPNLSVLVYGLKNRDTHQYFSDPEKQLLNSTCF